MAAVLSFAQHSPNQNIKNPKTWFRWTGQFPNSTVPESVTTVPVLPYRRYVLLCFCCRGCSQSFRLLNEDRGEGKIKMVSAVSASHIIANIEVFGAQNGNCSASTNSTHRWDPYRPRHIKQFDAAVILHLESPYTMLHRYWYRYLTVYHA